MNWVKKGLIYVPSGQFHWNKSHAQVPTVDVLSRKVWRIYYSARDRNGISYTSYIDVQAGVPHRILREHSDPILGLGKLGTFDDRGIMPSWVVTNHGVKHLFYVGWTTRGTVPYHNSIGLAVSADEGQSFKRYGDGPLFGPTVHEPYFTGTACVLVENGVWKNWYLSATKWEVIDGRAEPFYHLKYAESSDGVNWDRNGIVAIDYKSPTEGGIVKASVLRENGLYRMWYAFRDRHGYRTDRRKSYRIGYAESGDGISWRRLDDEAGIDVSESGWDSDMIAYPHVIAHDGVKYMFYNGNGFGKTGFGYAVAEK